MSEIVGKSVAFWVLNVEGGCSVLSTAVVIQVGLGYPCRDGFMLLVAGVLVGDS